MKKNNKYRSSNYNNQIYSLNYKFDSISSAGKFSGTALDLIKRYNELAKEAQGSGDYVEAENFRQYAEHYRKIVTEINDRKNQRSNFQNSIEEKNAETTISKDVSQVNNTEEKSETYNDEATAPTNDEAAEKAPAKKRSFKVIEIKSENPDETATKTVRTKPRVTRKPKTEAVAQ